MSRYERLPMTSQQDEMDAAFESDEEDEDNSHLHRNDDSAQRAPLLPTSSNRPLASHNGPDSPSEDSPITHRHHSSLSHRPAAPPGAYDFEYDYPPPPGSPPPPPTAYGNSNGVLPASGSTEVYRPPNILRRALGAILPTHYARDARGGGVGNDGVFSNLSAKPTRAIPVVDGQNGIYMSPEEARKEAPPSYASAQADAVPPYWETTILAPGSPNATGEMIIEHLPVGSFFSFLWNLLVSMSFQFVGFLLTYLLHTTHSAKFGSRAGLGITLIQYGFYLRSQASGEGDDSLWNWTVPDEKLPEAKPTFASAEEADKYYASMGENINSYAHPAPSNITEPDMSSALNDRVSTANEWLSFFLMTLGWFVLLTSLLGYWRVKRWERGIRRAAEEAANPPRPLTEEELARERELISGLERAFGLVSTSASSVRDSLGMGGQNWAEGPGSQARAEREQYEALAGRV